ncbi:MAG: UvrD-helicase domain-containing protein, partial [SAR324 cluster bacterium]|nr:UvrD-helicase domain-containing protein [SAR324 cluster bacterium]
MMEQSNFLNREQTQAVEHRNGPLLVIAGAGSGKTRVIEYRVLNLILNQIDPTSILLLTFTRKASGEMLSRAAKRDPRSAMVEGGTFHAFAVKLLRKHAPALGISKSFMILDTSDSQEALHRTATKMGFYEGENRFPQKSTLQKITSAATNKKKPVLQLLEEDYPHFIEH